ncbi:retrovirus-related pol polyprotein from transposon TNT 1-94 [Tanacetum coccineum]
MLEKSMYDSWASRIRLFIKGKKNGRMMLDLIDNGPLVYPTVEENGQTRPKKYSELTEAQQLQDDCDQGDDPIECINKAMAFLFVVASRFPPSNNQLRMSSNPINQATIQDGRVTIQQVQGRQTQSFVGTENQGIATTSRKNYATSQAKIVKCYNCLGEGHMAKQCTQPKRSRSSAWFKEKLMLAEALEADLDAYDSDCDDISLAKAILMANLSSCDPDVLSEVPYSDSYPNDIINQDVQEMSYSEQTHIDNYPDNELNNDSNIIP